MSRGGKRPGSGRPSSGRSSIHFRVDEDIREIIDGQTNKSDFINNCIRKAMEQYTIQQSATPGWWVCTDLDNMIVVRWCVGKFNDTQAVTFIDDDKSVIAKLGPVGIAKAMSAMTDWLMDNYRELL